MLANIFWKWFGGITGLSGIINSYNKQQAQHKCENESAAGKDLFALERHHQYQQVPAPNIQHMKSSYSITGFYQYTTRLTKKLYTKQFKLSAKKNDTEQVWVPHAIYLHLT